MKRLTLRKRARLAVERMQYFRAHDEAGAIRAWLAGYKAARRDQGPAMAKVSDVVHITEGPMLPAALAAQRPFVHMGETRRIEGPPAALHNLPRLGTVHPETDDAFRRRLLAGTTWASDEYDRIKRSYGYELDVWGQRIGLIRNPGADLTSPSVSDDTTHVNKPE